jgi:ubiquinone/menaquinone biosynthesis C-methylase UbiE
MIDAEAKEYIRNVQYGNSGNLSARKDLHQRFMPKGSDVWDFLWAHYDFSKTTELLEVGCGHGTFWVHESARTPIGANLTLTDFSPGMVEEARQKLTARGIQASFLEADVENLPFEEDAFDAVLAQFMLYHASSKERAIAEICRVLRPTGWAGIVLNYPDHMQEIDLEMKKIHPNIKNIFDAGNFSSVEGIELFPKHFAHVKRHDYEFKMKVTDALAVTRYAQSIVDGQVPVDFWDNYLDAVSQVIQRDGAFVATRHTSLFVCSQSSWGL